MLHSLVTLYPRNVQDRRGPQSLSGHGGGEKTRCCCRESNHNHQARTLVTVLTELPRFPYAYWSVYSFRLPRLVSEALLRPWCERDSGTARQMVSSHSRRDYMVLVLHYLNVARTTIDFL
jgi:hypothetical protein